MNKKKGLIRLCVILFISIVATIVITSIDFKAMIKDKAEEEIKQEVEEFKKEVKEKLDTKKEEVKEKVEKEVDKVEEEIDNVKDQIEDAIKTNLKDLIK